jgi:hypothetical protein
MGSSTFSVLQSTNLLAHWPTDWIILGAAAALIALDALRSGPSRAVTLALVAPAAFFFQSLLPNAAYLGSATSGFQFAHKELVIFVIVFVLLYIVIHRMVFSFSDTAGPFPALIAGIAGAIVLIITWQQVPALDSLWHFGAQVQAVFAESYRFWWLLVAYAGLAFARS